MGLTLTLMVNDLRTAHYLLTLLCMVNNELHSNDLLTLSLNVKYSLAFPFINLILYG